MARDGLVRAKVAFLFFFSLVSVSSVFRFLLSLSLTQDTRGASAFLSSCPFSPVSLFDVLLRHSLTLLFVVYFFFSGRLAAGVVVQEGGFVCLPSPLFVLRGSAMVLGDGWGRGQGGRAGQRGKGKGWGSLGERGARCMVLLRAKALSGMFRFSNSLSRWGCAPLVHALPVLLVACLPALHGLGVCL